jgi:hypothetical protein
VPHWAHGHAGSKARTHMLLHFGNVVGHVIDDLHIEVIRRRIERLGKRLSTEKASDRVRVCVRACVRA